MVFDVFVFRWLVRQRRRRFACMRGAHWAHCSRDCDSAINWSQLKAQDCFVCIFLFAYILAFQLCVCLCLCLGEWYSPLTYTLLSVFFYPRRLPAFSVGMRCVDFHNFLRYTLQLSPSWFVSFLFPFRFVGIFPVKPWIKSRKLISFNYYWMLNGWIYSHFVTECGARAHWTAREWKVTKELWQPQSGRSDGERVARHKDDSLTQPFTSVHSAWDIHNLQVQSIFPTFCSVRIVLFALFFTRMVLGSSFLSFRFGSSFVVFASVYDLCASVRVCECMCRYNLLAKQLIHLREEEATENETN